MTDTPTPPDPMMALLQQILETQDDLTTGLRKLTVLVERGFARTEQRLDRVDSRLDRMESQYDRLDMRVDSLDESVRRNSELLAGHVARQH